MVNTRAPLPKDEKANVITHIIGIPLSLYAAYYFFKQIDISDDPLLFWGTVLYFFSLVFVYVASTVYHAANTPRQKHITRIIDHIGIYLLIAGTHTPFIIYFLPNLFGYIFLSLQWLIALAGIIFKVFFVGRYELFSVILYVAMGWSGAFTIPFMLEHMSSEVLYWLIAGGLSYTIGVVFYMWERLPYNHAVWHLFVIGGSAGHYLALLLALQNN